MDLFADDERRGDRRMSISPAHGLPAVTSVDWSPEPAILIVDDNHANLVALEATLVPLRHPVVRASSAEEALRLLLQREFAVMLLDVQMPGMNGFELAMVVKSHPRLARVPVIFVTALSGEATHIFKGYVHGAVDYLIKPLDPDILRAKVNVFMELHRRQEKIRQQAMQIHQHEIREIRRRSDERFRELTESMPLPMWGVHSDGAIHVSNRAWAEYAQPTLPQSGSLIDNPFVHPDDVDTLRTRWGEGTRAGVPFDAECRLLRHRDKTYRWHLLRGVPEQMRRDGNGAWIVTATDVHAQKTAEEERARLLEREQAARAAAETANRMKDEFLANVSHELRTPLNAILGWSRMLRTGMLEASRVPHAIATIERSAYAQAKLINDILDVSRIVTGKLRLQIAPLDLAKVTSEAIETVRPAADAKRVAIEFEGHQVEAPMAGDASRLQQVMWNLISNAVKFTPKDGRVTVRLTQEQGTARISIEDTGIGIAPEFLPYVFDRFRQGDGTTTRSHDGLGLGLSIGRHLVELHGGEMRAHSAGTGKGSTFTVTLPVVPSAPVLPDRAVFGPSAERSDDRSEAPLLEGLTILYVDDAPEARELVDELLSHYGANVVAVETADQAILAVSASRPDLLVSDIGLPDEDGYALIRRIRSLDSPEARSLPAIALTAYARPEDRLRAKHEGFQMHLAKPVEPLELVSLVKSLVVPKNAQA
jgi:signal transduction histidine kinase